MAFLLGPGSKGNLLPGQSRHCTGEDDAVKSVERATTILNGEEFNTVHTGTMDPAAKVLGRLPVDEGEFWSSRSCCILDGEKLRSVQLAKGVNILLKRTLSPSIEELVTKVTKVGSLDEPIGETTLLELMKEGTLFKCAARLGERGRKAPRAIFLSNPFFRVMASVMEATAKKTLEMCCPVGCVSRSPLVRCSTGACTLQFENLCLSGDCTKYNEAIDASTVRKIGLAMGLGRIAEIVASMVRGKSVLLKGELKPCPGGMLMGMFNYSATAANLLYSKDSYSFSDDFVLGGRNLAEVEYRLEEMRKRVHNTSVKKTSISLNRMELNSVVMRRSGKGTPFRLAKQTMYFGVPPIAGPMNSLKTWVETLANMLDLNLISVPSADRLLNIRQAVLYVYYNNSQHLPQPVPEWYPVYLGGKTVLNWEKLASREVPDGLLCLVPGGDSPPDIKALAMAADEMAKKRRRAPFTGFEADLPPFTNSSTPVSRADVQNAKRRKENFQIKVKDVWKDISLA
uniref:RdRp n=1 Tax=Flavolineata virus TaxID=2787848 RepID=A0A7S8C0Q2_9VIRU|nr:RdRp [Flavolineata virus]